MKQRTLFKHLIFTLTAAVIVLIAVLAEKSDLWEIDAAKTKSVRWTKIDTQWTVVSNNSFADNSAIIVSRPFFVKDINELLIKADPDYDPKVKSDALTLSFITYNQAVRVFKEKDREQTLVYSFGNNGKQYVGSESGRAVHFIDIPEAGKEDFTLLIELQPSFLAGNLLLHNFLFGENKITVPDFYFGTRTSCLYSFIKKSFIQLIPIGVMLLMGLCVLYVYLNFLITRKQNVREYRYWGMLAITCAVGFFMESYTALLIFDNSFLIMFISTISIALTPRLFIGYMLENRTTFETGKLAAVFKILTPINIILTCVSAVIGHLPFSFIRNLTEVVLFLFVIYLDYEIFAQSFSLRTKYDSFDILVFVCSITLIADIVYDMIKPNKEDLFVFGRFGMMIFFVISAMLVINEVYDREQLKTRSIMMEQYAFRDISTGCQNATALYHGWTKFAETNKKFYIIVFSLLNEKKQTDTEATNNRNSEVKDFFNLLVGVFPKKSIYRTSSSRFTVLLKDNPNSDVNTLTVDVQRKIAEYNFKNAEAVFSYTIQIESFTDAEEKNFEDLYLHVLNTSEIK